MENTTGRIFLLLSFTSILFSCNSKNDKINSLLSKKKFFENRIDSINVKDERYRSVTGYNEMDDSLSIGTTYPHPELVDSIDYLKLEKQLLTNRLKQIIYSIDSLQKLQ